MNKQEAFAYALGQIEEVRLGRYHRKPLVVKLQGESEFAPAWLDAELEEIIGRAVKIEWRQVRHVKRTNNTGEITDGISAEERYYEDAARRGARTGD